MKPSVSSSDLPGPSDMFVVEPYRLAISHEGDSLSIRVTNISQHLVLVRLRSGTTLYLGGGEQSGDIAEPELIGNPRVEPLRRRGVITLQASPSKPKKAAAAKASAQQGETKPPEA